MALDTLLERLQNNLVTSVTSCNVETLQPKPAWIKDVTSVTSVTPETNKVQIKKSVNQDDGKSQDLEIIRQWLTSGGRPPQDYLFRLVIEKCEKDEVARKRFVQEAQATKAKLRSNAEAGKHPVVNEKVVRLSDRDDRRCCNDCRFMDHDGRCKQWQKTNPPNPKYRPVPDVLRNCSLFKPRE